MKSIYALAAAVAMLGMLGCNDATKSTTTKTKTEVKIDEDGNKKTKTETTTEERPVNRVESGTHTEKVIVRERRVKDDPPVVKVGPLEIHD